MVKSLAERSKVLYPIFKENRLKGKRVALIVNKLHIDSQMLTQKLLNGYSKNDKVLIEESNNGTSNTSHGRDCINHFKKQIEKQ
jgi:hypothetical protein